MEAAVQFFKALADESRLRIVGLLATDELSVEELATRLGLTPPTVSHHLNRLKEIRLVRMEAHGATHYYRLVPEVLTQMKRDTLSPERMAALARSEARRRDEVPRESDAEDEQEVLKHFFEGERLLSIPAQRKKRAVVLRWLAERFEPGRHYPERELNDLIKRHHPDTATLRRELIGAKLMERENGVYWRTLPSASAAPGAGASDGERAAG